MQEKGNYIGEHHSNVTQVTQAIFDYLQPDFTCLTENVI